MTAPASILPPRTDARASARDSTAAAANPSAAQGSTPGFAALLADEAKPAQGLAQRVAAPLADAPATADLTLTAEVPGKALPAIRQGLAAPVAALHILIGGEVSDTGADGPAGDASITPGDQSPADAPTEPVAATLLLSFTQPIAPPLPTAAPAPAATSPEANPAPAKPAVVAAPKADEASPSSVPQAATPATFAAAKLVFERETSAPTGDTVPQPAEGTPGTQEAASAVRAQPRNLASTLAALTEASERPVIRKLRVETDTASLTAKSLTLPDTTAGLVLGQLAAAQPSGGFAATPDAPTASTPQPLSFDQLVDSIARARDGADQGGPVAVALRHGEFGRISLRIESDATGLSVAMASPDPAFAPAVAAAHAAALAEPARPSAVEARTDPTGQNAAQGNSQSGNPSSQQRQSAASQRPAANPARPSASQTERRGGIFA